MPVSPLIHPSALVSDEAELADDVEVGAYAVIEGPVKVAAGCRIFPHAQVIGDVLLGEKCSVGRGVIIGGDPQDLSFDPATASGVRIGSGNTLREYVTIHRSGSEGGYTSIGDSNFLMGGAHLGHDVCMGDGNIIANNCMLAGHVQIGSHVFLGGGTGIHQFARLGDYCLTQGNSSITKDVPPFVIAFERSRYGGLNVIGLRRAGLKPDVRREIKSAVDRLFNRELPLRAAVEEVQESQWGPQAQMLIDFVATESRKGVMTTKSR